MCPSTQWPPQIRSLSLDRLGWCSSMPSRMQPYQFVWTRRHHSGHGLPFAVRARHGQRQPKDGRVFIAGAFPAKIVCLWSGFINKGPRKVTHSILHASRLPVSCNAPAGCPTWTYTHSGHHPYDPHLSTAHSWGQNAVRVGHLVIRPCCGQDGCQQWRRAGRGQQGWRGSSNVGRGEISTSKISPANG